MELDMSLKDALMKAGVNSTKTQNMRKKIDTKTAKKSEKHQQERNFCEVCELIQPDVERFKHKNPTIDAEWICGACADKEMIHDKFRITQQSEFAKARRYRREFGETLDLSEKTQHKKFERDTKRPQKNRRNNRNDSRNDNRGGQQTRGKRPNGRRGNQDNKPKKANYTIDEDGEKNFNC